MENKDTTIRLMIGVILITVLVIVAINTPKDKPQIVTIEKLSKEDSLQMVINQLQAEIEAEEDGWDKKEERYEEILFDYEYGLDRLKETHPEAYREFHRIIGFKEKYSIDTERDNKQRLKNVPKW